MLLRLFRPSTSLFRATFAWALMLLGTANFTEAQTSPNLRVNDVQFSLERSPYGGDRWLEMEISVDVRQNPDPSAPNPEFIDDLQVDVALAQNIGSPAQPRLEYYWTQVDLPTLKRGTHRLRFYLSPEQVERSRILNDEPYAWYTHISSTALAGRSAPPLDVIAVSANLREQARLDRFLELLDEQRDARAGLLLPLSETPFRDAYPEDAPTIKGQDRGD